MAKTDYAHSRDENAFIFQIVSIKDHKPCILNKSRKFKYSSDSLGYRPYSYLMFGTEMWVYGDFNESDKPNDIHI